MPVDDPADLHNKGCLCWSCKAYRISVKKEMTDTAAMESTPYQEAALALINYEDLVDDLFDDLASVADKDQNRDTPLPPAVKAQRIRDNVNALKLRLAEAEAVLNNTANVFGGNDVIDDIYNLDKFVEGYARAVKDTYTVLAKGIANAAAPEPKPSRNVAQSTKRDDKPASPRDYIPVAIQTAFLNVYKAACDHLTYHGPCEDIEEEDQDEAHGCDDRNCTYYRLNEAASVPVLHGFY